MYSGIIMLTSNFRYHLLFSGWQKIKYHVILIVACDIEFRCLISNICSVNGGGMSDTY